MKFHNVKIYNHSTLQAFMLINLTYSSACKHVLFMFYIMIRNEEKTSPASSFNGRRLSTTHMCKKTSSPGKQTERNGNCMSIWKENFWIEVERVGKVNSNMH